MKWIRAILPPFILALGIAVVVLLVKTRPEPAKRPTENLGELVDVLSLRLESAQLVVEAQGSVTPARKVVLQPEVTGRVTWLSPELVLGGRLKTGQTAVRIDARDYALAVEQQQANVEQAQLQLKLERMQHRVAQDEWTIIGEDAHATPEGRAIALRQPQLETAQANVAAAKSAQARARLAVNKTVVTIPFNGMVQAENVELGQLVSPQTQLAVLVGTDAYWVQVSVPADRLPLIEVPLRGDQVGAKARVVQSAGKYEVERTGRVVRLLGDLDPIGRMARVLVEIEDPLGLKAGAEAQGLELPLLLGAFVDVQLFGRSIDNVMRVPRSAIREGDRLFIHEPNGTLSIRDVQIAWRERDVVWVSGGAKPGELLITSRVVNPVPGMKLRLSSPSKNSPEPSGSASAPDAQAPIGDSARASGVAPQPPSSGAAAK